MNTRVQVARSLSDVPYAPPRERSRALGPAAGIALAMLIGSICWLGIFALIM